MTVKVMQQGAAVIHCKFAAQNFMVRFKIFGKPVKMLKKMIERYLAGSKCCSSIDGEANWN